MNKRKGNEINGDCDDGGYDDNNNIIKKKKKNQIIDEQPLRVTNKRFISFDKPSNKKHKLKKGFTKIGVFLNSRAILDKYEGHEKYNDIINKIIESSKINDISENVGGVFISTVIPNPRETHLDKDEEEMEFTQNEIDRLNLENLPLSLSHNDEIFRKVGYIRNQFIFGEQKDLMTVGVFSTEDDGYYGITGLIKDGNNQYNDVSLTHIMTKRVFNSYYHIQKTPTEMSLCERGRRDGSSVYLVITDCENRSDGLMHIGEQKYIYASLENLKKFKKRSKIKKKIF